MQRIASIAVQTGDAAKVDKETQCNRAIYLDDEETEIYAEECTDDISDPSYE